MMGSWFELLASILGSKQATIDTEPLMVLRVES